jgi:hypothetical protein
VPDLNCYSEPITALRPMRPIAVPTRVGGDRWQLHTLPGEWVTPGLAIVPAEPPDRHRGGWPGWEGRTRGWRILHTRSGAHVTTALFLPWAREVSHQLTNLPIDWTATAEEITQPDAVQDALITVWRDLHTRESDLSTRSHSSDPATRRRVYRQLRALGAEHRPI